MDGTPRERPVPCEVCGKVRADCSCPRDAQVNVLLPRDQPARVRRERRGGGKTVTVVAGLDPVASDLPALLKEFESLCAAGGTVTTDRIEIHGDKSERIVAALREMGYPAKTAGG